MFQSINNITGGNGFLHSNAKRAEFVANGLLREDEGQQVDEAVIRVAEHEISIVNDFRLAGLVLGPLGLGTQISLYDKQSDMDGATVSMDGRTRGTKDKLNYTRAGVPIPIIHKEYGTNLRQLLASRESNPGTAIDTAGSERATRQVLEESEEIIFNGSTVDMEGYTIPGLTTETNRNTGSLTAAWTNSGTRDIIADVIAMKSALFQDKFKGPYHLYIPTDYWTELEDDYSSSKGDRTLLERILAIPEIQKVSFSQALTAEVVMVQMTRDVADLAFGQDLTNTPWESGDGMDLNWKVWWAMAPRIKSDANTNSGIAHYSA